MEVKDGANVVETYQYDGLHRRIQRKVLVDAGEPPVYATYDYYHNEAWQVVEVRRNGSTNRYEQFAWHPYYIDAPLVRFYDAATNGAVVEH